MCMYLCSVLQMFLWKNHAKLLQNQQDWQFKSKFSQFQTFYECPREEGICPGPLSGTVTGRSSPSEWALKDNLHHLPPEGFSPVVPSGHPQGSCTTEATSALHLNLYNVQILLKVCAWQDVTRHHCFSTWFCCCFFTAQVDTVSIWIFAIFLCLPIWSYWSLVCTCWDFQLLSLIAVV